MKKFTKIALIAASIAAGVGLICTIGAFGMGLTWSNFFTMARQGDFSVMGHLVNWSWLPNIEEKFETDESDRIEGSIGDASDYLYEFVNCENLDVEISAGTLEIMYGDVKNIQVKRENTMGFEAKVKGKTLKVESGMAGSSNGGGGIQIILPEGTALNEVDLEVMAGTADLYPMNLKKLDAEVAAGQLTLNLAGSENDYNYEIECGAGRIEIGDSSYSGVARERKVENPGADKKVKIDCGVGEVLIGFEE